MKVAKINLTKTTIANKNFAKNFCANIGAPQKDNFESEKPKKKFGIKDFLLIIEGIAFAIFVTIEILIRRGK